MRLVYHFLRSRNQLEWFQVVKVALWGPVIKLACFLSAFSIFKQTISRVAPTPGLIQHAIELFDRYVHPLPEFLFNAIGIDPSYAWKDLLALYLLMGGIVTRFVKVSAEGLYGALQEKDHQSRPLEPPPGYMGPWEYQPGQSMSLLDRAFFSLMGICWSLSEKITRNRVELTRGEIGNTVMTTIYSWVLYPIWPISLVYLVRAANSLAFGMSMAVPHANWEKELSGKREGRDAHKRVAWVRQNNPFNEHMRPPQIILLQICFVLACFLLIAIANSLLVLLLPGEAAP
ncbi:hypothetical protein [Vreelandella titanicae]|uniref:Uncharacterized protein n=1 Tax=Vreelandella titanicae TaxID=664683 RepID=A0A558JF17_9GAMM|nr:hypothetical protein [Halomonas titanicae]TVU92082.1 hypothetical protein FQP89_02855 [Halomonas titanicae]